MRTLLLQRILVDLYCAELAGFLADTTTQTVVRIDRMGFFLFPRNASNRALASTAATAVTEIRVDTEGDEFLADAGGAFLIIHMGQILFFKIPNSCQNGVWGTGAQRTQGTVLDGMGKAGEIFDIFGCANASGEIV